jgi:hypothetical protein
VTRAPTAIFAAFAAACTPQAIVPADTGPTSATDGPSGTSGDTHGSATDGTNPQVPTAPARRLGGPSVACRSNDPRRRLGDFDVALLTTLDVGHRHVQGGNGLLLDLDRDGSQDVVLVGEREVRVAWGARDVAFTETDWHVLTATTDATAIRGYFGATAFDGDDDGDLDLFVSGRGVASVLLEQTAPRAFGDATLAWGLDPAPEAHSTGASLSDIDGDGDLDLYVAGHGYFDEGLASAAALGDGEPDRLYLRTSDGFRDASDRLPDEARRSWGFLGGFLDADRDGDDDLYLMSDFGQTQEPTRLLLNDGGVFRADLGALGLDHPVGAMGLALGDVDRDGFEDAAVVAWDVNQLFLSKPQGWFDAAAARGILGEEDQHVAWGSEFLDANNDGRLDLLVNYGYVDTHFGQLNPESQADALLLQRADGTFHEGAIAPAFADEGPTRGAAIGDVNGDGWLDVLKVIPDGRVTLATARCDLDAWVAITVQQPAPNRDAVGATVEVIAEDGRRIGRVRAGGTGFGSGAPGPVYIGLGAQDAPVTVLVRWPDGAISTLSDVPIRAYHTVIRDPAP